MPHLVKSIWRDASGDTTQSEFATGTTNQATIEAVLDEMQALSDLELVEYELTEEISPGPTGVGPADLDATHPYADDKAVTVLEFSTANRKIRPQMSIPGPKWQDGDSALLYGNDLTLNKTRDDVIAFINAVVGTAVSAGGTALTLLRRGYIDIRRGKRAAR